MLKKFIRLEGPITYKFVDPDTGFVYQEQTKQALINRIISYREQNRLEHLVELGSVIDNYLCGLPENCGKCEYTKLKRGWYQYMRGGMALLGYMFVGRGKQVSDEVAEARAQICIGCPQNVFPDRSGFLKWSDEVAQDTVGSRKTTLHANLGSCVACTCLLKAKVFFMGPFKLSENEKAAMPDFCWQKEASNG